jgi:RNA polymerase sigma-70 factor (ECF subfamily)
MSESSEENNEQILVEQLRAGDPSAQAKLFRRFRRPLWRQALKIVGNPAVAEEIVHDAWIRAMAAIGSFEGRSRLGTWLTSIVLNEARCHRRREVHSRLLFSLRGGASSGRSRREGEDPEDRGWIACLHGRSDETPETILLDKEAAGRVERALSTLTRTQRSVVVLRDFQGASPAEACEVLEITDIAQRVHLCRARATLRRALEDDGRLCA